ncbi:MULTISPECIES: leucine-rich repeat domain-containing protein [Nitrosomonas]|uniref:Internalin A n=1 Tax=Nitrosomonas communis TaxID=44574 RepID=A0A5D3YGC5_9PROT|nr:MULTISPECIES: leucine-rich repeat domain-containing protein [Nitrosomonas]TYP87784.1 internalin A [Nitrosomonas communis]UVS60498.1 leucine-rich repeat domain-containing protein [Nitrosomonas sp. PLL12]
MKQNSDGFHIARERIAHEAEAFTGFLDLGQLGLTALPEEIYKLQHLQSLNLGSYYINDEYEWLSANSNISSNKIQFGLGQLSKLPKLNKLFLGKTDLAGLAWLNELKKLQILDCSITQISDLSPLAGLSALQELYCSNTPIRTLSPLAGLSALQKLHCYSTPISDLSPLAGLSALQVLNCSNTLISDLSSLAGLSLLQELHCIETQISDLSPLAGLSALQKLHCSNTLISDLSPLAGLSALQVLDCSSTPISDLSPLTGLSALQVLDCSNTPIMTLSPLAGLSALQKLDCRQAQISDLSPLTGLSALQVLDCSNTPIMTLSPLTGLSALQVLDCSNTSIMTLSPLAGLSALQKLDCRQAQISDLSPLTGLSALQVLDCSNTPIMTLSPLTGLSALQVLDCSNTSIMTLSPLAGLSALQKLDCRQTQISDLSPLTGLSALQVLDCSNTPIMTLSPLTGLSALQVLDCSSTPISDLSPLAGLSALQVLHCGDTPINDLRPLAGLSALKKLDCSNCSLTYFPKELLNRATLTELVLFETKIPGIPSEVLSQRKTANCLEFLRSHFADLEQGTVEVAEVKLMVLGNGQIGKTQICRNLRGEKFDDQIPSTHGILISSTPFPLRKHGKTVQLNIWDFGGQDIYHGTHALFMRTRAIFMLVWIQQESSAQEHVYDGMIFRDEPLGYWLNYIKYLSGSNNPVLIVQTQCDHPEDEARYLPGIPRELLETFRFCKPLLHYSSLKNRGREALNAALQDALIWLQEQQETNLIGIGRYRVKCQLEELRNADMAVPPENRQYRTLSQEYFRELCEESNGKISSPEHLLEYLHNTGTIFYRKGLFDDRIILDQSWALEAIYTVFHRKKCYKQLRQLRGRFTRSLLEILVWNNYSKDEQMLFLSMMQSCGICFIHHEGNEAEDSEDEYIAPDLLPDKDEISAELEEKWDSGFPSEGMEFEYELYHPGLLRSFISKIGRKAGLNALYWKNGVCLYEKNTGSRALIEQETIEDWQGKIRVQPRKDKQQLY